MKNSSMPPTGDHLDPERVPRFRGDVAGDRENESVRRRSQGREVFRDDFPQPLRRQRLLAFTLKDPKPFAKRGLSRILPVLCENSADGSYAASR
jgi:hypothetical protein